jgi:hypothetical protein
MDTKKLCVAGVVALVAAGLSAPVAPAYVLDPGGERLAVSMTSRTSQGLPKQTTTQATAAKPKPRPKPPLEP